MTAEHDGAVDAAARAVNVILTFANACGQPGTPPAGHAQTIKVVGESVRILAELLPVEARLTARVLTPPAGHRASGQPTAASGTGADTHGQFRSAGSRVHAAAGHLHGAWKDADAILQAAGRGLEPDAGGGKALRLARQARRALGELKDALENAGPRGTAWSVAAMNGHRSITQGLLIAVNRLAAACERLREPVGYAFAEFGPAGQKQKAADGLDNAAAALRQARRGLRGAETALTTARDSLRAAQKTRKTGTEGTKAIAA